MAPVPPGRSGRGNAAVTPRALTPSLQHGAERIMLTARRPSRDAAARAGTPGFLPGGAGRSQAKQCGVCGEFQPAPAARTSPPNVSVAWAPLAADAKEGAGAPVLRLQTPFQTDRHSRRGSKAAAEAAAAEEDVDVLGVPRRPPAKEKAQDPLGFAWPPAPRPFDELVASLGGNSVRAKKGDFVRELISIQGRDNVSFLMGRTPTAVCPVAAKQRINDLPKTKLASSTKTAHHGEMFEGVVADALHTRKKNDMTTHREMLIHQLHILRK
eukprot:TRINITY_DN9370_c0_g1_i1.p2 TRINITY_DN9370_c0_g1~~TRINITY_DN9370_c0_g1_i1.p2  ORF type:complete len:295 (+),score=60.77 TRINITY_DN9370_c0_g1_i1:81-887(+)